MRYEKKMMIKQITNKIDAHSTLLVIEQNKMSANKTYQVRKQIHDLNAQMMMLPKKILCKEIKSVKNVELQSIGDNSIAVCFTNGDGMLLLKELDSIEAKDGEVMNIIGLLMDGEYYTGSDIEELVKIPSLDVLKAQFLGVLSATMSDVVGCMNSLLCSVPFALENKTNKN